MAPRRRQGVARAQGGHQLAQRHVLLVGIGQGVGAFELDADGKVIAAFAARVTRHARVPGAFVGGDELDEVAVAADEEMRRHAQPAQAFQPGMGAVVQRVQEQPGDFRPAELPGGQADVVQHEQRNLRARRPRVAVGGGQERNTRGRRQPAMTIQKQGHGKGACRWSSTCIMPCQRSGLSKAADAGRQRPVFSACAAPAGRARHCTRSGRSAAGPRSAAGGCRNGRSAPWIPARLRRRVAGGLAALRAGLPGRRHAAGETGREQHHDDYENPEQQLAHVNLGAESFPARTGCRCRPESGTRNPSASSAGRRDRASPRRAGPPGARRTSARTAA